MLDTINPGQAMAVVVTKRISAGNMEASQWILSIEIGSEGNQTTEANTAEEKVVLYLCRDELDMKNRLEQF